jgi:putative ABC transport system permease protein
LSIAGVALAVGLLLSVTSIGLGLAAQDTVRTGAGDYWILPDESQGSAVVGVGGTRFGRVHAAADRLERSDGVAYATPVLLDLVRVRPADGETVRGVFIVGIISREAGGSVVGLPTDALRLGDPYFANGTFNGTWTGETVASASAASALNVSTGDTLEVLGGGSATASSGTSSRQLTVESTQPARAPGLAQLPVLVVHLAEAQELAGAMDDDKADQFHVDTTTPAAKHVLADAYPEADVVSREEMLAYSLGSSDLPLAMSVATVLIAIVVGVLSIVTTMGFKIADDSEARAVLAALGVSRRTRVTLVATETLATTLAGGVLGIGLWLGSAALINIIGEYFEQMPLAVVRPVLGVYGVVTALAVGLVSLPVLLLFARRDSLTEGLPIQ